MQDAPTGTTFPMPLDAYAGPSPDGLLATLADRIVANPFNAVATTIFVMAIVHTFVASRFTRWAHLLQHAADDRARRAGRPVRPSVGAELLHFLGEIEVVFGLWAIVLVAAIVFMHDWPAASHYLNESVNYTEPMFVVVIM